MKRFLVLLMVLGVATTANASLCTLSPDGTTTIGIGSTITIAVMSPDSTAKSMLLELDDSAADAAGEMAIYSTAVGNWVGGDAGMTMYAAAGGFGSIQTPTEEGYAGLWGLTGGTNPIGLAATAGEWFSIVYKCNGPGDMYITLYTDAAVPIDQLIVHQTPEPFTMGLLGLGGLFLRRRK